MEHKLERLIGIIEILIKRSFEVEHCGGNWDEKCKDVLSERCQDCCEGKELIDDLHAISELKI